MRLIDADQMLADEAEAFANAQARVDVTATWLVNDVVHKKFQMLVNDTPTVDAVQVVRCKDCRHRGDGDVCPMRHIVWSEEEGYYFVDITMDDYYCSFGERRESDAGN